MNFLGYDFIISSLLLLSIIFIIVFIYRDKLFSNKKYLNTSNNSFVYKVKFYLSKTYPKFDFDFSILDKKQNNENPDTLKYEQVDNLLSQYIHNRPFSNKFLKQIQTSNLWSEYAFYSKPNKDKLPEDWIKRKKVAYERDNSACVRCSKKVILKDSVLYIVTPISEGGQYYIENLATLCPDCNKILKNKSNNLEIQDILYDFVKQSIK